MECKLTVFVCNVNMQIPLHFLTCLFIHWHKLRGQKSTNNYLDKRTVFKTAKLQLTPKDINLKVAQALIEL